MPFEKAVIPHRSASIGTGIKVTLRRLKSAASMNFSISPTVAASLGWSAKDKLEVLIGTGTDHGKLRFRKNNSTGEAELTARKTIHGGGYLAVNIGHQPRFVDRRESARWCQWERVEDGWIEVVLPKWANETAIQAAKPAPAATQQINTTPVRPARDVTAMVMGDPPAGRREMLAKMGEMRA